MVSVVGFVGEMRLLTMVERWWCSGLKEDFWRSGMKILGCPRESF